MRFTVIAFTPVPDVETARRNLDLADLSDKDVAKVLHHHRKQATGHSEALTWDQQLIASVTLVQYSLDYVDIGSYSLDRHKEPELIDKVFKALGASGQLVTWEGNRLERPLLHFRCMKHHVSDTAYWTAIHANEQQVHVDLQSDLFSDSVEMVGLDAFSRRFYYPGMLDSSLDRAWEGCLEKEFAEVRRYSDLRAFNTYLLALKVLGMRGDMTLADASRARKRFADILDHSARNQPHVREFLDAWDDR